jgi:NAD(P)-dependent dehydrogenase (short-subunit alcohol dehydrogenase family)
LACAHYTAGFGIRQDIEDEGGTVLPVSADATDSVAAAFERVRTELGDPEVLVYNAGAFQVGGVLEVSPDKFDECFKANCAGAFYSAREVLPAMVEAGHGTILLAGASAALRGRAKFSALAVGKFGLRALAQSMAREFGPQGIHVSHVIINGQINTPSMREMSPDREVHTLLSPARSPGRRSRPAPGSRKRAPAACWSARPRS